VRSAPSRAELREHLVTTRIAGSVQTTVGDVLRKARLVADGDPDFTFGISGLDKYRADEVLDQVAAQFGWRHTPGEPLDGPTWIDPDLVLDELDRAAERITVAGREGQRVLLGSGHPTGIMSLWQHVGLALAEAGAKPTRIADGELVPGRGVDFDGKRRMVRYVLNVGVLSSGANLYHTHSPAPMELVLDRGVEDLDLVLADHGWAGAAIERGYETVSIADVNDPALPMAKHDGRTSIMLGLDDNVLPWSYEPVAEYLVAGLR
jgi:Phosphatase